MKVVVISVSGETGFLIALNRQHFVTFYTLAEGDLEMQSLEDRPKTMDTQGARCRSCRLPYRNAEEAPRETCTWTVMKVVVISVSGETGFLIALNRQHFVTFYTLAEGDLEMQSLEDRPKTMDTQGARCRSCRLPYRNAEEARLGADTEKREK
ncbi:Hypothetical protein, putative [Bodo saltans]|uniref:Uncharacterized protein n=1 Tax=Bodo saltans TaxID=75058 RepID=A0A0S4JJ55_BODSA|nr:Hypothetical protein, putative [Bodo saltans]|eukprot:CUG89269.1 Hypothetical protein, putative [Bodo saltans]